jgi:hypothetical protein
MNVLLRKSLSPAQVSRQTMQRFMIRSEAEDAWERLNQKRHEEIEAAIDAYAATLLWMFHTKHGYGRKRLRQLWEDTVRCRCELRQFYRGEGYVEGLTGENAEDFALISALKSIGVDIRAWEQERFEIDEVTGEVKWENTR